VRVGTAGFALSCAGTGKPVKGGKVSGVSWGSLAPGTGGNSAYAFLEPPYSLQASEGEIQALYAEITSFILPRDTAHEIRDWSSPDLPEVHPYFELGAEWWGIYLLTIWRPDDRTLVVIMASTSD